MQKYVTCHFHSDVLLPEVSRCTLYVQSGGTLWFKSIRDY